MSAFNEPTIATDELRPTRIEVDLDVLAENYGAIAAHVAPARVMPILKANAYGHGLVEVGRVVERLRAPYIGVAYLEEGVRLRQHGVRLPVLVLGGILGSQIPRFLEHDITLTASSVDKLRAIEEHAVRVGRPAGRGGAGGHPRAAGALLGDPGGLLQGRQGRASRQLRRRVGRAGPDARRDPARRLRRRLRARHEWEGRGDRARQALSGGRSN